MTTGHFVSLHNLEDEVRELMLETEPALLQKILQHDGSGLELIPPMKQTREMVLAACRHSGAALELECVDKRWRKDKEIVLTAVRTYGHALRVGLGVRI